MEDDKLSLWMSSVMLEPQIDDNKSSISEITSLNMYANACLVNI